MPDKNDNEEFALWILETIPLDELMAFIQTVMPEAMKFFQANWNDYCDDENEDEDE